MGEKHKISIVESPTSLREKLDGALIPAVPVPFDRAGNFAAAAQESYVRYLSSQPMDGVAVWAHTGRGLHLPADLASAILESWHRGLGPARLLIAGAGAAAKPGSDSGPAACRSYIQQAARMAERARSGGAAALLAHPPRLFRDLEDRRGWILEYHQALAAAGLPIIAFYLYREAGGISYTLDELGDLLQVPAIAAIKMATLDSVCTYQEVVSFLRRQFPETTILTGEDRFLGYSLLRGASGALIGMGAALPAFQKRLIQACRRGPGDEAIRLTLLADRFAECTFIHPLEGYIQRMLHALAVLRVIPEEAAFDPWHPPIPAGEKQAIEAVVADILKTVGGS